VKLDFKREEKRREEKRREEKRREEKRREEEYLFSRPMLSHRSFETFVAVIIHL